MSRPEHIAPAEMFYNAEEASKYGGNSRMILIQTNMTERALELCKLPPMSGKTVLDIGCGSGISGEVLTEYAHYWVGMDISPNIMLVALEGETEGDLILFDMGQGFKFRPGSFDAFASQFRQSSGSATGTSRTSCPSSALSNLSSQCTTASPGELERCFSFNPETAG